MSIDLSTVGQLKEIFEIFISCKGLLEKESIFQWNDAYPSIGITLADINNGDHYSFIKDGKCAGVVTLNRESDQEYESVNWSDTTGKFLVVHRLAVHPFYQKQGIASRLMDFVEDYARKNNFSSIRLDAYSGNTNALEFYIKRTYIKRGEVYFSGRALPFFCFEKFVNQILNS